MRTYEELRRQKVKSDDRIIKLKPMTGGATKVNGTVDSRLFTGNNNLHALKGPTGLWYMKYDDGALPGALQQSFTSFDRLVSHVRKYFKKRNIEIVEIIE